MENKCFICEKREPLQTVDDSNICEKIHEIFSIRISEYENAYNLMVCNHCIINLNTSYELYHQVKNAEDRLRIASTIRVKVEIKEEVITDDNESFFFSQYNNDDHQYNDESDEKEESVFGKRDIFGNQNTAVKKPIGNAETPAKRKYNKIPPELRKKKNRGIRRAKESLKITTKKLYEKEMRGEYTDTLEFLQILDEDKLKNGLISPRVYELFSPSAWPTFDWSCHECPDMKFPDILKINEHMHYTHKQKFRRDCIECYKTLPNFAAYLNHMIVNHATHNKFCCILCSTPEYRWNLKDLYIHYQKQHSKTRVIFCIYCGLHFICGAKLKEHLISKHKRDNDEGGQFMCDFCGWKTELRHTLKNHMVKHVSQSDFMCDQCTLTFASAAYLNTHISQVHSKLEIKCTKCDKSFKSGRRLRCHDKAVHQNNKNFICQFCQKAFHAQYRLNSHLRLHTHGREDKFQCTFCDRKFKYKPGMLYHIRAAHTGERPFSCPVQGCSERFFDWSNARKHISGSHNSELKPIRDV